MMRNCAPCSCVVLGSWGWTVSHLPSTPAALHGPNRIMKFRMLMDVSMLCLRVFFRIRSPVKSGFCGSLGGRWPRRGNVRYDALGFRSRSVLGATRGLGTHLALKACRDGARSASWRPGPGTIVLAAKRPHHGGRKPISARSKASRRAVSPRAARTSPQSVPCRSAARALLSAPMRPTPRPELSLFSFSLHRAYRTLKFLVMVSSFVLYSHDFYRDFCASVTP